jgi:hypothetical protein
MEVSMYTTITSTWSRIINHFFPIFTAPTAQIFTALVNGWVLCTARRTVTGMIRFGRLFIERPHDAFHRFFSCARWSTAELWRLLAILLVKKFYPTGIIHLDLDDTLFHRPGRKVSGASKWRDPVRSEKLLVFARGLNLVVLTMRVCPPWGGEPIGLPVNMRLRLKDGPSHIDHAQSMLVEIASWLPNRRFICHCDGFYTALIDRHMSGVDIISRMRKDAIIFDLPPKEKPRRGRKRVRGEILPKPKVLAEIIMDFTAVTTIERGRKRKRLVWTRSIEDTFKNTKQLLGGQQPQSFKRKGPERAAAMSFWLYSAVWLWYLQDRRLWKMLPKMPWYRQKHKPSFADALACLRQQLWKERINCMFDNHSAFEKIPKSVITALSYAA